MSRGRPSVRLLPARAVRLGARTLACVAVALVMAAATARALTPAEVPNPRAARGSWVADVADILSEDAERSLDAVSAGLRQRVGAEIAVVTVPETGGQSPKQFATELFNLWGVGDRTQDNGVLVLIVTEARRVEVETGYGAEGALPDHKVGRILDTYVVPRYRQGDWDGGTVAGVRALAAALAPADRAGDSLGARSGTDGWQPVSSADVDFPTKPPGPSPGLLLFAIALFFGVVLVGGVPLIVWFGRTFRWCPQCRRRMRRLTPQQESAYLSAEERFEELLRSMDHVVWRCDDCQRTELDHRARWFSGYSPCPQCKRRTLQTTTHTIVAATYEHSGTREVTRTCKWSKCGYRKTHRESIPRLEHTSSSSSGGSSGGGGGGGSFGGGSSGGGGAGRGW